jgi:hypothetical protein
VRAEVHDFGNFRGAIQAHRRERREVRKNSEAALEFREQGRQVALSLGAMFRADFPGESDE